MQYEFIMKGSIMSKQLLTGIAQAQLDGLDRQEQTHVSTLSQLQQGVYSLAAVAAGSNLLALRRNAVTRVTLSLVMLAQFY